MSTDRELIRFKMVLFGKESVGKTSLVQRFILDSFQEQYISTLGYNVYEKQIEYDKWVISLMIFDIGGQERFTELRKKYAAGADTAFIVFDITNQESFNSVKAWKDDLLEFAGDIPFIVIGNKNDLINDREVPTATAQKVADEIGALAYIETSAKTGNGIENAFQQLAIKSYQRITEKSNT